MIRTLAIAAMLGAVAAPAFAGSQVTINVARLDAPAVHQAILRAAQSTCTADFASQTPLVTYYGRPDCIRRTVAKAEADYASMRGLASR